MAAEKTVIIVGAGPSGLAMAGCLTQHSIPYIILDREDCFASLWKKHSYDRLHLHLPKQYCELPHMKFPTTYPKYVPKNDFIKYLDDYVTHFGISPLYQRHVTSAKFDENTKKWHVLAKKKVNITSKKSDIEEEEEEEEEEEFVGEYLVVASGETSEPKCPKIEGLSSFQGKVVHTTKYKNGKEYEGKSVLVIGAGNSGFEIAFDLANHGAKASIVVRSTVHILSRGMVSIGLYLLKHLPFNLVDNLMVILSKIVYGDISKYGLRRPNEGPFFLKVAYGKYPIIDVGTFDKIKSGEIQILPEVTSIRGNDMEFNDGTSHPFDVIIFATGFRRSTSQWLQGDEYMLDEDGMPKPSYPNHWKGEKGLYCVGLARRGFRGAAMDAENIANDIIQTSMI